MANKYWLERMAQAQTKLTNKSIKQVEKQLTKYYGQTMTNIIEEFSNTYDKLSNTVGEGKQPTPADLYKLDKYWKLQGQLKQELLKLGNKQISALSQIFELNFFEIYYSLEIEGMKAFTTIDKNAVTQMINQIWCSDGKSWSQRIWENTTKLQQALNDSLIDCVVSGKKTTQLKNMLQEQFNVSIAGLTH